ncbi:putative nuclear pore complex subunit Nup133 [Talaromyces proteolyticus]|uniref:Nuclear pore complex subunit Nup133 n=1 Tax=Talaromyces proteolyticus TaxID=1131652 RepID=A0AAD4PTD1_9EURO|nr:putative nuclear pore complex subunit Nup133 [Talaromyces proteolyticus]KAH8693105.1 putative nuclear pore complex subunit Nup133 [Talaromyces proteolyticus]
MFAPTSGGRSLRNPRRRQRTSLDESVKPPNPKRQKSTLREKNIQRPANATADLDVESDQPLIDVPKQSSKIDGRVEAEQTIAFRGPKKLENLASLKDSTVVLSSNDYYTVTQLPLPEQLLEAITVRCVFNTKNGFALLLTETRALIWPYTEGSSQIGPEIISLSMPDWCKSDGVALMGTLVSNVTSTIPGLLVVAPVTGKLIYWESASNATLVGIPKQKQSGLRGAIPGLLSGEQVTDVINAEPSGIILTFSTGRVAQVTIRDPQGKPALSINLLHRGHSKLTAGGFFDGIRSVLGSHSWRKEIAAVRTGSSLLRGQRDVIIAYCTALLEIWDSHWNNVNTLRAEVDLQDDIYLSLGLAIESRSSCSVRILDCIASHEEQKSPHSGEVQQETTLFFLALVSHDTSTKTLAVVRGVFLHDKLEIRSSHKIDNPDITNEIDRHRPKLHITKPWNTAFIVMEQRVWIISLASIEPTPSAQLLESSTPRPFQDRVQFQTGDKYEIIGTGSHVEEGSQSEIPTCVVMLREFGLIRISALSSQLETDDGARVTAKQKIEQAVFFGTMSNTPLSFIEDGGPAFSVQEIEDAALEICKDILRSDTKFIPHANISLDHNLRLRSKALGDLAAELLRRRVPLSRQIRWKLLSAGEKLASQRSIWKLEEEFRKKYNSQTFLARAIGLMNEKFRTKHGSIGSHQSDHVRQWFFHDTFRMQHIIPWIFNTIRGSKGSTGRSGTAFIAQIYQASELSLAVLESAFRFREDHALQYGLGEELFENGVLVSAYNNLPEFWTSESMVYSETMSMLDLELESSRSSMQQPSSSVENADSLMLDKIAQNSCRRLRVLNMMLNERSRWLSVQNDPKIREEGISLKEDNQKKRKWQLFKMAGIGQLEGAISLAEELRDMDALVELMVELQDQIKSHKDSLENGSKGLSLTVKDISGFTQKIADYFENFGEQWADAFFSRQIRVGQSGVLLSMKDYQPYVTRFLRKYPSYGRLAWINEIVGEEDYETASDALEKLALTQEPNLWNKRVQLSLAKVTKLASWEKAGKSGRSHGQAWLKRLDDIVELAGIQELLYEHILPALHGAIDEKAELELAMEHFGNQVSDRPALKELLEGLLRQLISREALNADQLINLITLVDEVRFLEGEESAALGREFYIALRVLRLSDYASTDPVGYDFLERLIWRRCIIRDDWCAILKAEPRFDDELKSLLRGTALVKTLTDCIAEGMSILPVECAELYPLSKPSEAVQFGSYELVRNRFKSEQWPHIERDLNLEIDTLKRLIEEGQLALWFPEILGLAEEDSAAVNAVNDQAGRQSIRARSTWV